jgi:Glycosyltransferase family 87
VTPGARLPPPPAWRRIGIQAARPAAAAVAILALTLFTGAQSFLDQPHAGDLRHYEEYARLMLDGKVPYRDFHLEYPPGSIPFFLAAGPAGGGYYTRFRLLALAVFAAAIVLANILLVLSGARPLQRWLSSALIALAPVALTPELVFDRYDVWPTALVLLALATLIARRLPLAMGLVGLGTITKIYPAVLLPIAIAFARPETRVLRRGAAAFVVVAAALVLPFAIVAPRGTASVFSVLLRRPLHIESLGGSLVVAAGRLGIYRAQDYLSFGGSWDLRGTVPAIVAAAQALLWATVLVLGWLWFARSPREVPDLLLGAATAVTTFVVLGKVFSPQYMTWLVLVVPLVPWRAWRTAVCLLIAALGLTYAYYERYASVARLEPTTWLVLARNVVLVLLLLVLLRALRRRAQPPPDAETTMRRDT